MATLAEYLTAFFTPFEYKKITIEVQRDKLDNRTAVNTTHFKSQGVLRVEYAAKGIPFYDAHNPEAIDSTHGAPKLTAKTSHAFTLAELTSAPVLAELKELQKAERAIWFMVSEGDGEPGPAPNENCRSQKNVTCLKACFLDTDNCPVDRVERYLSVLGIEEHIRVETSPGKFHFYFLLNDCAPDKHNLQLWKCIQHCLARLGEADKEPKDFGTDGSMHDYSKVLRVPGFLHQKKAAVRVKIASQQAEIKKWDLLDLYQVLGADRFSHCVHGATHSGDLNGNGNGYMNGNGYHLPTDPVTGGSRHAELMAYLGSAKHECKTHEDLLIRAYGFIVRSKFEDAGSFLPGGSRHEADTVRQVMYAWQTKLEAEKSLFEGIAVHTNPDPQADLKEALHFNQEIFLRLPGLAGDMIREGCEKAPYPIAPMFFAAISSVIGTFKAKYMTCEGFRPCNYFLCTAAAGDGKSFPKNMLLDLLQRTRQEKIVRSDIRSGQGLLPYLQRNQGYGCLLIDEAARILRTIQNDHAQSYEKEILTMLLKFYDIHDTMYTESEVRKDPKDRIELPFVRLNMVMFGTQEILDYAFTPLSVTSGWLPRLLVFNWNQMQPFQKVKGKPRFSNDTVSRFREVLTKAGVADETRLLLIDEKERELIDVAPTSNRHKELRAEIAMLQTRSDITSADVRLSAEAEERLTAFGERMHETKQAEIRKESGLEALYTRAYEQVHRLIPVFVDDGVASVDVVNALVAIVEQQVKVFATLMVEKIGMSDKARQIETLFTKLQRICAESPEGWVTKREAVEKMKNRSRYTVTEILLEMQRMDYIEIEKVGKQNRVYLLRK